MCGEIVVAGVGNKKAIDYDSPPARKKSTFAKSRLSKLSFPVYTVLVRCASRISSILSRRHERLVVFIILIFAINYSVEPGTMVFTK